MKKLMKNLKKGFTLVELVVVIAIIAILAGVVTGTYFGITNSAHKSAALQLGKQYSTVLQADVIDGQLDNVDGADGVVVYTQGIGIDFASDSKDTITGYLNDIASKNGLSFTILATDVTTVSENVSLVTEVKIDAGNDYYAVINCTDFTVATAKK